MLCCVSAGKAVGIWFRSLYCKSVAYLHNLKENWLCSALSKLPSDEYIRLIVSEPFVHLPRDFPATVKACSPGDPGINITYLAERTGEKVGCIGKLPQRPVPNRIWQVYSEVEIQMCGGHRERLLDQLFPIIVTVVNCVPQHLHLWWKKKKKTPNICRMINLTTSPPIRGWMSLTLYRLNTSPSQDNCAPLGADKWALVFINEMTGTFLFTFVAHIYRCLTFALARMFPPLSFCPRDIATSQKHLFSWGHFSSSFSSQAGTRFGYVLHIFVMKTLLLAVSLSWWIWFT